MSNVDEMIKKFQQHDWFYEYLEDGSQWREAAQKHRELMAEVRKLPMNQVAKLIEHVPEEARIRFGSDVGIIS